MPSSPAVSHESRFTDAVPPSPLLTAKLAALRRKIVWSGLLSGLSILIVVMVEVLALELFLDWWFELRWVTRLLFLIAQAVILGWVVYRFVLKPLLRPVTNEQLALRVERARPQFQNRLIASVQLTKAGAIPAGASPIFAAATVEQTEAIATGIDFSSVVSTTRLTKLGALAISFAVLGVAALISGWPTTRVLIERACLSNASVPRKTRVHVPNGNRVVGRSENLELQAFALGKVPAGGRVEIRYPDRGRARGQFAMQKDTNQNNRFVCTLENVQESFQYIIYLNDGRSDAHEVEVIPPPVVLSIQCEQTFPAYTRLPPRQRQVSDLSLLAGSVVTITASASKELSAARLRLAGLNQEVPVALTSTNSLHGRFTVPAKGMNGFSILLRDSDGIESKEPAVYHVEIIPDKPPDVRVTWPERKEELFTRSATLLLGMEASDDFEIARLRLRYVLDSQDQLNELTRSNTNTIDLDVRDSQLTTQAPLNSLKRRFEWKLSTFASALPLGTRIEYWIEAEDNNDVTGPGIGSSEHRFARIVSEEEKRSDLWNRATDTLTGINDLAADQEKLSQSLGAIIREKTK